MQSQAYPPRPDVLGDGVGWITYIQVLLILLGVVCLCLLALRFTGLKLNALRGTHSGPIRILARHTLEPRRTIYVIEAGGQILVVGCAEGGLTYLTELDPTHWASAADAAEKGYKP